MLTDDLTLLRRVAIENDRFNPKKVTTPVRRTQSLPSYQKKRDAFASISLYPTRLQDFSQPDGYIWKVRLLCSTILWL